MIHIQTSGPPLIIQMCYSDSDTKPIKNKSTPINSHIVKFIYLLCRFGPIVSCRGNIFCRLLQSDSIGTNGSEERIVYIKEALALRHSSTMELMKLIEDTIKTLMAKIEIIDQSLQENSSAEDAIIKLYKIDELMKEEVKHLHVVIEALHVKHKEYDDMIQSYSHSHSVDQSEIKRIAGDLEENWSNG